MEFCPKCGSRLTTKKSKTGKKIKISLLCLKCGYTKKETKKSLTNKISKVNENPKRFVTIITK